MFIDVTSYYLLKIVFSSKTKLSHFDNVRPRANILFPPNGICFAHYSVLYASNKVQRELFGLWLIRHHYHNQMPSLLSSSAAVAEAAAIFNLITGNMRFAHFQIIRLLFFLEHGLEAQHNEFSVCIISSFCLCVHNM